MAANLDLNNDRVNFAYREDHGTIWHQSGQIVQPGTPLADWKREAGLEWTAIPSPISFNDSEGNLSVFPDKIALFRSDNQAPLSIVSDSYKIVQPSEVVDFFSDLLEKHDMEMSSCGSLFDGKRFFATAKLNNLEIFPGDTINGYLLLATSLDGSMATTAKTTSVRTVCSNTLTMAMNQKSANMIKVPHSTEFDANKAKLNLGLIEESQVQFMENMRKLAAARVTDADAFSIYKNMFYNPEVEADKQHGTVVKRVNDIMELYMFGNGAKYGRATMYNVLQGITDYFDHKTKSRTESARFFNAFYGKNESIKLDSLSKLLELSS